MSLKCGWDQDFQSKKMSRKAGSENPIVNPPQTESCYLL